MDIGVIRELKDCEKYEEEKAGKALASFIYYLDTVESSIGEFVKPYRAGDKAHIITGIQIENSENPVNILSNLGINVEVMEKFTRYKGKPSIQLLKSYINKGGEEFNGKEALIFNKFKGIVGNKTVIIPFKPNDECIVTATHGRAVYNNVDSKITSVSWYMDKNEGQFKGKMMAKLLIGGTNPISTKLDLSEYGTAFKMKTIERTLHSSDVDRRTVVMSRFGFVKPLVIKDNNIEVGVDGSNMYLIAGDNVYIIGEWNTDGLMVQTEFAKTLRSNKAYKHLMDNIKYIEKHRRFLAPYGVTEHTVIKL